MFFVNCIIYNFILPSSFLVPMTTAFCPSTSLVMCIQKSRLDMYPFTFLITWYVWYMASFNFHVFLCGGIQGGFTNLTYKVTVQTSNVYWVMNSSHLITLKSMIFLSFDFLTRRQSISAKSPLMTMKQVY